VAGIVFGFQVLPPGCMCRLLSWVRALSSAPPNHMIPTSTLYPPNKQNEVSMLGEGLKTLIPIPRNCIPVSVCCCLDCWGWRVETLWIMKLPRLPPPQKRWTAG
jgi:hypothetical protein